MKFMASKSPTPAPVAPPPGPVIQPLYIEIPPDVDPGLTFEVPRRGQVVIHALPPIDASAWTLEDLERNRDRVREGFVAFGRDQMGRTLKT